MGLPGQMVNACVLLLNVAKFPFPGVVHVTSPLAWSGGRGPGAGAGGAGGRGSCFSTASPTRWIANLLSFCQSDGGEIF